MNGQVGIKQPLLGLLATVIVFFIAFALIIMFNTPVFLSWGVLPSPYDHPIQIIVGLVWQSNIRLALRRRWNSPMKEALSHDR